MKIDNKRLFTADIYSVQDYNLIKHLETSDTVVGGIDFTEKLENKNVVMIKFKKKYVPIWYVQNVIDYVNVLSKEGILTRNLFLIESTRNCHHDGDLFLKNVKPLFSVPGRTSLKELIGIQKYTAENDDTYSSGMIL